MAVTAHKIVSFGKPRKTRQSLTKTDVKNLIRDAKAGFTNAELCSKYNIAGATVHRHCQLAGVHINRVKRWRDRDRVIKLIQEGEPWREVARKHGVSCQTVYTWCQNSGVKIAKRRFRLDQESIQKLVENVSEGMLLKDAAALAGIDISKASRICKKHGVSVARKIPAPPVRHRDKDRVDLIIELGTAGFSRQYIMKATKTSYASVCSILSKNGVTKQLQDKNRDRLLEKAFFQDQNRPLPF